MKKFEYLTLNSLNFKNSSLDEFERYQKVTHCWRKKDGIYALLPVSYTEDWTLRERREKAEKILKEIASGSVAFGAMNGGKIVGFALVNNALFGR